MRKLLRANGSRLLRDRAFWLLAALMAALGVSMAVVNAVHARQDGEIWTMDYTLFIYVILAPILSSVFTALFTLIAMLCQNKAHTTAGCILLTFALLFAGVYISSTLEEPEYLAAYSYTENGVTVEEPEQKNPYYISGVKRQVYECLLDLTPGGQVIQIGEMGAKKPVMLAVYDGLILLLVTGFGLVLFRREDLK
ncbi:MAG: ABC transporter permease subunit [Oscillospiraceae bacterium]|nr:ABC transporter permease subunit [Clostridiales bacterium]MDY2717221.1 ABC transporter permease subunit [Oscillospiraceae bacterium]